ncbi:MAG: hypothetical protein R3C16_02950 [Hyphomonadaceae bacterium]
MARSISARIARDRAIAGVFAFIAALPPIGGIFAMGYVAYAGLTDQDGESDGLVIILALLALFAFLFFILARWTYAAVRAALTPQRVQAMWLRRFQSERGGAFRTSRVIDQLSRHGVSALTLQDRDVQLSFEQRRNRLAPMFWILFIPIAAMITFGIYLAWESASTELTNLQPAESLQQGIGQVLGAFFALIVVAMLLIVGLFFGVLGAMAIIMLLAALAGPLGAFASRKRDDFKSLPKLLRRIQRGKGRRGAVIVRISDENWRAAVCASLSAVDVAIIDLSDVSDHVAWEIGEAVKACGANALVFIARDGVTLSDAAKAAVRGALGREHIHVVHYPDRRGADSKGFAHDLRAKIYAAADQKAA